MIAQRCHAPERRRLCEEPLRTVNAARRWRRSKSHATVLRVSQRSGRARGRRSVREWMRILGCDDGCCRVAHGRNDSDDTDGDRVEVHEREARHANGDRSAARAEAGAGLARVIRRRTVLATMHRDMRLRRGHVPGVIPVHRARVQRRRRDEHRAEPHAPYSKERSSPCRKSHGSRLQGRTAKGEKPFAGSMRDHTARYPRLTRTMASPPRPVTLSNWSR